jgi:hypothetical protein
MVPERGAVAIQESNGRCAVIVREFFSTSAQMTVAALLFVILVLTVYSLWDVAIDRWSS